MTLIVSHRPNTDLHFTIKSIFAESLGLDSIFIRFRDVALPKVPSHDLHECEVTHGEFCARLKDILLELNRSDAVSVADPRYVFLEQLRSARLADGYGMMIDPDLRMSKRIVLAHSGREERVADLFGEAQSNILEAGRYIMSNTDLRVDPGVPGGVAAYDDPRLELLAFSKTAQIAAVKKTADGDYVSVRFPKMNATDVF